MSWICDLALAAGMTLAGNCQPSAPPPDQLPPDDPAAWSFRPPAPKEEPKPAPAMPPVVIKQEVVREVRVEVPAPTPKEEPKPAPTGPDALEMAVAASYLNRAAGNRGMPAEILPSSLPGLGSDQLRPMSMPAAPGAETGGEPSYQEKYVTSSMPVDNGRIITTDRYIHGILETGINTQLDGTAGGPVVIQVTRDVYGYHGRNLLVPKGSRLVCGIKSLEKVASSRAPLRCSRVLLGESRAEIIGIKANVTDVQGSLGVSGDVDHRFFERYGTAFILAGVSAAVRAASAGSTSATTTSSASATGSSSTYSGSGNALATGGQELSQRLGEITAATLEQTINLTPILKVAQGTRLVIRPDTDWYIAKVE